ncbi:hypothetical protein RI367_005707 [Sorochytrium milnesiophthora]
MSSELVWQLIRKNNSFLVKRNGVIFSKEEGNLRNINTFKYSGLAQRKTIAISKPKDGKTRGFTLVAKGAKHYRKPQKAAVKVPLAKGIRRAYQTARAITKSHGRPELTKAALVRISALNRKPAAEKKSKSDKQ